MQQINKCNNAAKVNKSARKQFVKFKINLTNICYCIPILTMKAYKGGAVSEPRLLYIGEPEFAAPDAHYSKYHPAPLQYFSSSLKFWLTLFTFGFIL